MKLKEYARCILLGALGGAIFAGLSLYLISCSEVRVKRNNNPSLKLFCKEHFSSPECADAYEPGEH